METRSAAPHWLSRAVAAIAETGTLVLASGPDNPASLNYLPEVHIVVVEAINTQSQHGSWLRERPPKSRSRRHAPHARACLRGIAHG